MTPKRTGNGEQAMICMVDKCWNTGTFQFTPTERLCEAHLAALWTRFGRFFVKGGGLDAK